MKILFQCLYGSGGAIANLATLIESIIHNYPELKFIVLCSPQSKLIDLARFPNVELEIYGEERRRVLWRFRLALSGLRRAAKKHRATVVWSVNTGSVGSLSCPQILQINNAYQVYPISFSRYHPRGLLGVFVLKLLCKITVRQASLVICQTTTIAEYARKKLRYFGEIGVIGKAVGYKASQMAVKRVAREGSRVFRFGYVAAKYKHKNHQILFLALGKIPDGIDLELHLTLTREEVAAIGGDEAVRLVEQGRIVPHGWIAGSKLPEFYSNIDGCVMPSLIESLSSAHLEAMYFRKPQVVADRPYARELCGDAAVYADPRDSLEWAREMVQIIKDADLGRRLVERGRIRFESFPQSWAEVAEQWHSALVRIGNAERSM